MTFWQCGTFQLDLTERPLIMGILNVSPDSFSDGYPTIDLALRQAELLVHEGADIIDVGGESTRPGSQGVDAEEELGRVLPVVERLAQRLNVPISVDTQKAAVAERVLQAGASIVNHVSSSLDYRDMIDVLASSKAGYVTMHMRDRPSRMQHQPTYSDVVREVGDHLGGVLQDLADAGIARERILPDPGIGFGKTLDHNLALLQALATLSRTWGRPLLMGVSRKSWLTHLLGTERDNLAELDAYTALASTVMPFPEVAVHRVHNVGLLQRAFKLTQAMRA